MVIPCLDTAPSEQKGDICNHGMEPLQNHGSFGFVADVAVTCVKVRHRRMEGIAVGRLGADVAHQVLRLRLAVEPVSILLASCQVLLLLPMLHKVVFPRRVEAHLLEGDHIGTLLLDDVGDAAAAVGPVGVIVPDVVVEEFEGVLSTTKDGKALL